MAVLRYGPVCSFIVYSSHPLRIGTHLACALLSRVQFSLGSLLFSLAHQTGVPGEWQFPNLRPRCLHYRLSSLHSRRRRLVSSEFSDVSCDSLMIVRAISCLDSHQLIRSQLLTHVLCCYAGALGALARQRHVAFPALRRKTATDPHVSSCFISFLQFDFPTHCVLILTQSRLLFCVCSAMWWHLPRHGTDSIVHRQCSCGWRLVS